MFDFVKKQEPQNFQQQFFVGKAVSRKAVGFSDRDWSALIRKYPNFASVAANAAARDDYQSWIQVNNLEKINIVQHFIK